MIIKAQLKNVKKKIFITLFILIVYILGLSIPVPFAEVSHQFQHILNDTPITIISFMSGANLMRLSLFMIGFNPMMIAMLLMQLLMMVHFLSFDTLSLNQMMGVQQFLTLIITLIQAITITFALHLTKTVWQALAVIIILTAGSLFVVWLGIMNMKFGIGGTIVLILFNIITTAFPMIIRAARNLLQLQGGYLWIGLLVLLGFGEIVFWIAFCHAYYPIKTINTTLSSRDKPVIVPIGLNAGAMMTYMIGMALLMLPTLLGNLLGPHSIFANIYFDAVISGLLAFLLFYFFMFMTFNPKEQAKQLRNSNNYILGIRPGEPTRQYIKQKLLVISFPGALLNSIQLTLGLLGIPLLGKYAGFAIIPMYAVMIVMFMIGIRDALMILLFPKKYQQLEETY